MNMYYIVFEKFTTFTSMSWVIRNTPNDMDTYDGLTSEIRKMEEEYKCDIRITNWKKLKTKSLLTKLSESYKLWLPT